jgi:arylsulfatase A-like enzyme
MKALRNWRRPGVTAPNGKPWNVLLLMGDDFIHDIISAEGMPTFVAGDYTNFFHFPYASAEIPVCFPGRAGTLTGCRGAWTLVENNNDGPSYVTKAINHTIFRAAKGRGLKTAFVGKGYNQLGKSGTGGWGTLPFFHPYVDFQRIQWGGIGYFDFKMIDDTGMDAITHAFADTDAPGTDYALDAEQYYIQDFFTATPVGQPWFIYWSTKGCHTGEGGSPIPPARFSATPVTITEDPSFGLSRGASGVPSWLDDEQDLPWDAGKIATVRGVHEDALRVARGLEDNLLKVLATIASRGETNNTVVIVMTDNTIASGEHRLTGKGTPHRSGLNCQLHIRVPGLTPFTSDQPVQNLDIAPTICDIIGASMSVTPEGYSILNHMQDQAVPVRDAAVCVSYAGSSPFASLRFNDHTYYEMEAHDELTEVQPGGWLYSDSEAEHAMPSQAEDAAKLAILKPRLGTIAPE